VERRPVAIALEELQDVVAWQKYTKPVGAGEFADETVAVKVMPSP
jgi:hypothetical protein